MTEETELIRGSGNVYRDLGYPDADLRQAKALLAAEILKVMDERAWSTRKAQEATGINHSDFARIRRANLGRFTLDRLMSILARMDREVGLQVTVRPRVRAALDRHPSKL